MSNKKGTSREKNRAGDEVEELLLAAEDDLLLKLNVNSHLSHTSSSSSPLDDDLARRFEALKSSKNAKVPPPTQTQQEKTSVAPNSTSDSTGITKVPLPETQQKEKSKEEEEELERVIGADLSARFAALKGSSSKTSTESQTCSVRSNGGDDADDDDDEEDEVEKVIQWAMDAARLDPSSPTDDEDEEEEDYDDESDDEDNDQRRKQQQKK